MLAIREQKAENMLVQEQRAPCDMTDVKTKSVVQVTHGANNLKHSAVKGSKASRKRAFEIAGRRRSGPDLRKSKFTVVVRRRVSLDEHSLQQHAQDIVEEMEVHVLQANDADFLKAYWRHVRWP